MVGRDAELSQLLDVVGRATSGEAQVAVVTGEAGIGKTRLMREFVACLPEETLVASGHAVPLSGGSLPYGVAADLLRSLVREVGIDFVRGVLGTRANVLSPLVPRLGEGHLARVDRLALFSATQELLEEISMPRTVVLQVEDCHWADESSLELLTVWARTLVRGQLLIAVTLRESGVGQRVLEQVNELRRLPHATVLELGRLDDDATVQQMLGLDPDLADDAISTIRRLSEGVPLYVEELVAAHDFRLPGVIQTDMAARLRSLGPEAARLLQIAAVEPRPFSSASLAIVASATRQKAEAAIDLAAAAGLLERAEHGWRFAHELLRRGAAQSLPPSSQLLAHEAWADHLSSSQAADDLVSAALHRAELGANRESFVAYVKAAESVTSRAPSREAQTLWRRALEVVRDAPGAASEAEHDQVLGVAATFLNNVVDYRELADIDTASRVAPRGLRGDFIRLCRWTVANTLPGVEAPELTQDELTGLGTRLEGMVPTPLSLATLLLLLDVLDHKHYLHQRDRIVEVFAAHAARLPELGSGIDWVTEWRLYVLAGLDHEKERLQLAREAVAASLDRDWATRVWACAALSGELLEAADIPGAVEQSRRGFEMVTSTSEQHWYLIAQCRIEALRLRGRWDDALALVDRLRTRGTLDAHWWLGTMHRFFIARERGDHDVLSTTVEELWSSRFLRDQECTRRKSD